MVPRGSHPSPWWQHGEGGGTRGRAGCPHPRCAAATAAPQDTPLLWDLLLPVGRPSQAFEQDWEESWVVLWAVIAFTALLAEAVIQGKGNPLPSKKRIATLAHLQPPHGQDWPHPYFQASLIKRCPDNPRVSPTWHGQHSCAGDSSPGVNSQFPLD